MIFGAGAVAFKEPLVNRRREASQGDGRRHHVSTPAGHHPIAPRWARRLDSQDRQDHQQHHFCGDGSMLGSSERRKLGTSRSARWFEAFTSAHGAASQKLSKIRNS